MSTSNDGTSITKDEYIALVGPDAKIKYHCEGPNPFADVVPSYDRGRYQTEWEDHLGLSVVRIQERYTKWNTAYYNSSKSDIDLFLQYLQYNYIYDTGMCIQTQSKTSFHLSRALLCYCPCSSFFKPLHTIFGLKEIKPNCCVHKSYTIHGLMSHLYEVYAPADEWKDPVPDSNITKLYHRFAYMYLRDVYHRFYPTERRSEFKMSHPMFSHRDDSKQDRLQSYESNMKGFFHFKEWAGVALKPIEENLKNHETDEECNFIIDSTTLYRPFAKLKSNQKSVEQYLDQVALVDNASLTRNTSTSNNECATKKPPKCSPTKKIIPLTDNNFCKVDGIDYINVYGSLYEKRDGHNYTVTDSKVRCFVYSVEDEDNIIRDRQAWEILIKQPSSNDSISQISNCHESQSTSSKRKENPSTKDENNTNTKKKPTPVTKKEHKSIRHKKVKKGFREVSKHIINKLGHVVPELLSLDPNTPVKLKIDGNKSKIIFMRWAFLDNTTINEQEAVEISNVGAVVQFPGKENAKGLISLMIFKEMLAQNDESNEKGLYELKEEDIRPYDNVKNTPNLYSSLTSSSCYMDTPEQFSSTSKHFKIYSCFHEELYSSESSLSHKIVSLVEEGRVPECVLHENFMLHLIDNESDLRLEGFISDVVFLSSISSSTNYDEGLWYLTFAFQGNKYTMKLATLKFSHYINLNAKFKYPREDIIPKMHMEQALYMHNSSFQTSIVNSKARTEKTIDTFHHVDASSNNDIRPLVEEIRGSMIELRKPIVDEKNLCLFCGCKSKNFRRKKPAYDDYKVPYSPRNSHSCPSKSASSQRKLHFLQCSECKSRSCIDCIEALLQTMDKYKTVDRWNKEVRSILYGGKSYKSFVGHCCEIKNEIQAAKLEKYQAHVPKFQAKVDACKERLKAGLLHLPELYILIDAPMVAYVDVHGLGEEKVPYSNIQEKPGLVHAVIDKDIEIPSNISAKCNLLFRRGLYLDKFVDVNNTTRTLKIVLDAYQIDQNRSTSDLLHFPPTVESLKGSKCIQQPDNFDVWLVIGMINENSIHSHLVNARWKSNLTSPEWSDDNFKKKLLQDLLLCIKHNGLEVTRKGGSGGLPTYSNNGILKLLASDSGFPRKGKGVKVVKCEKVWRFFYLKNPRNDEDIQQGRSFAKYEYAQPQVGGQLNLTSTILQRYKELIHTMTTCKYNTALLVYNLSFLTKIVIQSQAVINAIHQIDDVRRYLEGLSKISKPSEIVNDDAHVLNLLSLQNKFSLVSYPVCYHKDVFDKGCASLENKVCLSFATNESNNIGRGGDGNGRFVFALLDWTNTTPGIRRARYIAAGGVLQHRQRLTLQMWVDQFNFHWNENR